MDLDVTKASRLAPIFHLCGVSFAAVEGRMLNPEDFQTLTGSLDWKLTGVDVSWVLIERELRMVFPFVFLISFGTKPLFGLNIVVRLDYRMRDDAVAPTDDDIDHYAGISGFMHAWPYVRAEVQALTTKLGIPPLTLPPILSGHVSQFVNSIVRLPATLPEAAAPAVLGEPAQAAAAPKKKSSPRAKKASTAKKRLREPA